MVFGTGGSCVVFHFAFGCIPPYLKSLKALSFYDVSAQRVKLYIFRACLRKRISLGGCLAVSAREVIVANFVLISTPTCEADIFI